MSIEDIFNSRAVNSNNLSSCFFALFPNAFLYDFKHPKKKERGGVGWGWRNFPTSHRPRLNNLPRIIMLGQDDADLASSGRGWGCGTRLPGIQGCHSEMPGTPGLQLCHWSEDGMWAAPEGTLPWLQLHGGGTAQGSGLLGGDLRVGGTSSGPWETAGTAKKRY